MKERRFVWKGITTEELEMMLYDYSCTGGGLFAAMDIHELESAILEPVEPIIAAVYTLSVQYGIFNTELIIMGERGKIISYFKGLLLNEQTIEDFYFIMDGCEWGASISKFRKMVTFIDNWYARRPAGHERSLGVVFKEVNGNVRINPVEYNINSHVEYYDFGVELKEYK